MENVDMFNNATAQLFFHNFLDRMRDPSAADLVRSIKKFISTFQSGPQDPERDSESVQEFLTKTEEAFRAHPLWTDATEEDFESSGEGLEKYLMFKLFPRAFPPLPEDAEVDQRLSEKIALLQRFVRPKHLDISESFQNEPAWLLAQKELQNINSYKAPRDKLVCILNCCRIISNLLLNVTMANKDNPPGADDFLPVLIYVVIKANPPQLHSNLQYIQRYRHGSRLVSEASYFYTNLVSAESFLENLNAASLTMDPTEFEEKMEAARRELQASNAVPPAAPENSSSSLSHEKPPPEEEVPQAHERKDAHREDSKAHSEQSTGRDDKDGSRTGVTAAASSPSQAPKREEAATIKPISVDKLEAEAFGQVLEADKSGQLAKDYPFLYASAGDLRVMDVESLLHEYKELVLRYVALRRAVEGPVKSTAIPALSLNLDPKQEVSRDIRDDPQEAPVHTDTRAQVVTRPGDTAESFTEESATLQEESGVVSGHTGHEEDSLESSAEALEHAPELKEMAQDVESVAREDPVAPVVESDSALKQSKSEDPPPSST